MSSKFSRNFWLMLTRKTRRPRAGSIVGYSLQVAGCRDRVSSTLFNTSKAATPQKLETGNKKEMNPAFF